MIPYKQFEDSVTGLLLPLKFREMRVKLTIFVFLFLSTLLILSGLNVTETTRAGFDRFRDEVQQTTRPLRAIPAEQRLREIRRSETFQQVQATIIINNLFILFLLTCLTWVALYFLLLPLARAVEERERFITLASHELRTPLAILYSELSLSKEEKDIKELRKIHKEALTEIKRLQNLSDTLLGRVSEEEIRVDIVKEVYVVWESLQRANSNNIRLVVYGKGILITQPTIFHQLLYNLMENAVKYAKPNTELLIEIHKRNVVVSLSNQVDTKEIQPGVGLANSIELAKKLRFKLNWGLNNSMYTVSIIKEV